MRERPPGYNQAITTKQRQAPPDVVAARYTSMQAAQVSGVPFFTVDYWDRSRFLRPTLASGDGRGRGRERTYSYRDVLLLRVARELRDQQVSLETLRRVVSRLGKRSAELVEARYVLVSRDVEFAQTPEELLALLHRAGRPTFGILLDLREAVRVVGERARRVLAARSRRF